ncbi:hypothetical protein [Novosphingobium lentum]|uniref:hypothetical protein n=1 Tax=Novosphingobium lentum TaxID=145287 RepID=UPI000B106D96|nr:hypothetical protein [Novosphingobium lentum]
MAPHNWWLFAGGMLSAVASLAHLGCIWRGAAWYRFFGAGERMARQVERGATAPTVITLAIAATLALWAVCALSGAGVLPRLPLLYPGLTIIAAIYLLRAAALPLMLRTMPDRSTRFLVTSSAIVLAIGLIHAVGLYVAFRHGAGKLG